MTWQELEMAGFAPKKADPELNGETTTLSGTPVRITLPLTMRQPFLMTGAVVIVMFSYESTSFFASICKKLVLMLDNAEK